ncbi:MAG: peptide chain release factor N(5)-glutamine methyltransferase [Puniceicoccaceae bacterium]
MQTVLEVRDKTVAYFEKAEIESPKNEAERLMAETLGIKRLDLFLNYGKPLTEDELELLRDRIRRRAKREPLQYILGYWDFHDTRLQVQPGALIPRPETELLVEAVIKRLEGVKEPRIVDLGTGSGAIALALAKALPNAKVLAVEKSPEALSLARANADALGLREQVAFRSGDWLAGLNLQADCIVSNPPYLTESEWAEAQPEVRDHEPKEALVAGDAGMADLKAIVSGAKAQLAEGGFIALEMGIDHGPAMQADAEACGYSEVEVVKDDHRRDRFLFAKI